MLSHGPARFLPAESGSWASLWCPSPAIVQGQGPSHPVGRNAGCVHVRTECQYAPSAAGAKPAAVAWKGAATGSGRIRGADVLPCCASSFLQALCVFAFCRRCITCAYIISSITAAAGVSVQAAWEAAVAALVRAAPVLVSQQSCGLIWLCWPPPGGGLPKVCPWC